MSLDYSSATINNIPTPPMANAPVQSPIGHVGALPPSNAQQINGQIGTRQDLAAPLSMFNPLLAQPSFVGAIGTPGFAGSGAPMVWASLASPTSVGTTGTLSGTAGGPRVFTAGAGAAVALAVGVAGGAAWVRT